MNTMSNDELLSAYIDDELSTADRDALLQRLADEPELALRLEKMRSADEATRNLYAALDDRPMPDSVLALLADAPDEADDGDNVISLDDRRPAVAGWVPAALAAGVALVAGFFIGGQTGPGGVDATDQRLAGMIAPDEDLALLLEREISDRPVDMSNGSRARVLLTFSDGTRYCRQFRVDGAEASVHGLACRDEAGWNLDTIAYGEAQSGGYQQASLAIPAALRTAVSDRIGSREPVSPEEETSLISDSWKKPSE